jgi:fructokinase
VNRIGIDLGGTKIEAVALAPDGRELGRLREPTPSGDYEAIIAAVCGLVAEMDLIGQPTYPTVGVGTPGAISPASGVMKNSNSPTLNGRPLDTDLAAALGRPVAIRNDADCFALSEARDGSGAGAGSVFGVIIGTGVGGGVVIDGKAIRGPNAVTGEWGHNPLPWARPDEMPGPICYCGKRGCIETFLSGPGFAALDQSRRGRRSAPEIVEAARSGDGTARSHLADYADRLARSLSTVINIIDPDVIVLGGGMSNVDELYEEVPRLWSEYVFGGSVLTRLVRNAHGDSSGVRGAAWLVT